MPRKPHHSPEYLAVERMFAAAVAAAPVYAPGARLLLGCSAGGDSMALLDLCARARAEHGWELAVAHLDHAQRPESAAEAAFVRQQAGGRGLEFFIERLGNDKKDAAAEEQLRAARHAFFNRIYSEWQATAVLLAHQADDAAETVLMRLCSGAGPTGLAGIQPLQQVGELTLARPLLRARRAALRQYLRERELAWHDDPSNADPRYKRNWVRGELLPLLGERLGYDCTEKIAQAAELIGSEAQALRAATGLLLEQIAAADEPEKLNLHNAIWKQAEAPLRRQLLREWLWRASGAVYPPAAATVEQALEFAQQRGPAAEVRSVGGRMLRRENGLIGLMPQDSGS